MPRPALEQFRDRAVLLLQSPVGPFFTLLGKDLQNVGAKVHKVNFNGGDWLFFRSSAACFRKEPSEFAKWLDAFIGANQITDIMLCGASRLYHKIAIEYAQPRNIPIYAFDEGDIRPNFISLRVLTNPTDAHMDRLTPVHTVPTTETGRLYTVNSQLAFRRATVFAILYALAAAIARPWFPHCIHHRDISLKTGLSWLRGFLLKPVFALTERPLKRRLLAQLAGTYFFVPLQVPWDHAITQRSHYKTQEHFISEVIESFAKYATITDSLVFKHHPLSRGFVSYRATLRTLARRHGLAGRIFYLHDMPITQLICSARGVVTINSTVGLEAIRLGACTKTLGSAHYDAVGITFGQPLADFWNAADGCKPDQERVEAFVKKMIAETQLNGNFYLRNSDSIQACGIHWKPVSY